MSIFINLCIALASKLVLYKMSNSFNRFIYVIVQKYSDMKSKFQMNDQNLLKRRRG